MEGSESEESAQHGQQPIGGDVHARHGPHLAGSLASTCDRPDVCAIGIVMPELTIRDEETTVRADREQREHAQQVLRWTVDHADS